MAVDKRKEEEGEWWTKKLPLHLYVAKLREEARLDRLEIEGLWTMWSFADQWKGARIIHQIKLLTVKAASKEERADRWERELVRRAESAATGLSPRKRSNINGLGWKVRK